MAKLTDYRLAKFEQGDGLERLKQFESQKEIQGGVCAGLCNCWILKVWEGVDPCNVAGLKEDFDLASGRQRIWNDVYRRMTPASDVTTVYNSISYITRIRFTQVGNGQFCDPLAATLRGLNESYFFMQINSDDGENAHQFAFYKSGGGIVVFDPNHGVFAVADDQISGFSALLWVEYAKNWDFVIGDWQIWEVREAGSIQDRMRKVLPQVLTKRA